jgi:hypothetical protein
MLRKELMSYYSKIAMSLPDGRVKEVTMYDSEGYPLGMGIVLADFWRDRDKVSKLIDLGDIHRLGVELPPDDVTFDAFEADQLWDIYYHVQKYTVTNHASEPTYIEPSEPTYYTSKDEFFQGGMSHTYYYDQRGRWWWFDDEWDYGLNQMVPVRRLLEEQIKLEQDRVDREHSANLGFGMPCVAIELPEGYAVGYLDWTLNEEGKAPVPIIKMYDDKRYQNDVLGGNTEIVRIVQQKNAEAAAFEKRKRARTGVFEEYKETL